MSLRIFIFLFLAPLWSRAATYTVSSTADTGAVGTLRWAIEQANADPGSTINIQNDLGTITLSDALPVITAAMTINGGAGNTVSGANLHRVFFVHTANATDAVSFQNLTIANGYAKGGDGGLSGGGGLGAGGAIFVNVGAVSVANVALVGNTAQGGNGGDGAAHGGGVTTVPSSGGGGGLGGNGGNGNGRRGGGGGGYAGNGGTATGSTLGGAAGGGGLVGDGGNSAGGVGGAGGGPNGGAGGSSREPGQAGGIGGGGGGSGFGAAGGNGGIFGGGGGAAVDGGGYAGYGGNGGDFGGGGGAPGSSYRGGNGGYGGGGGAGSAYYHILSGGNSGGYGGFGGGGGGSPTSYARGFGGAYGGAGGGYTLNDPGGNIPGSAAGGGGAGLGGAIFVRSDHGASLTFASGTETASSVIAGQGGTSLPAGSFTTLVEATDGQTAGTALFLPSGDSIFQSGVITNSIAGDSVTIRKTTLGTLTLNGANSFSGGARLEGGVLALGNAGALGTAGTITFNGGVLRFGAANAIDYSARFSTEANQQFKLDTNGQNVALSSSLQSSGGSLTKLGGGTLTLNGINSFSGTTEVTDGTLKLGSAASMILEAGQGVTASGTAVTGWSDLSGQGNNAVAGGGVVTVGTMSNGQTALRFQNGSYLSTPLDSSGRNYTIFSVVETGTNVPSSQSIVGSSINGALQFRVDDASSAVLLKQSISELLHTAPGTVQGGTPALLTASLGNAIQAAYCGTTLIGSASNAYGPVSEATFRIGNSANGDALNGSIAALLIYNSTLNSDQISQVQAYLQYKYFGGPAAEMPSFFVLPTNSVLTLSSSTSALDLNGNYQPIASISGVAGSAVYLGGGALTVGSSNASMVFAGNISDAGGDSLRTGGTLTKVGSGTLTLTGSNSFSGGVAIHGGVVAINADANLGASSGALTLSGGMLRTTDNVDVFRALLLASSGTLELANETYLNIFNEVSGPGGLTKSGTGYLTLAGTQTYAGPTQVQGGFLKIESGSLASSSVNLSSANFYLSNSSYAGQVTGSGTFNGGAGVSILTGTVSQAVNTVIDWGTLQIGDGGNTGQILGNIHNDGILAFNRSDSLTYSGSIAGTGVLQNKGAGTLTLTGTNSYSGGTVLQGGLINFQAASLGSGSITFAGGGLQYAAGNAEDITSQRSLLFVSDATIDTNGNNVTFANAFGTSGTSAFTKLGGGILTLNAALLGTGPTVAGGGTLKQGVAGAFRSGGTYVVNSGTLDLNGYALTVESLSGDSSGVVALGAGNLIFQQNGDSSFAGTISGSGGLTKQGPGRLALLGSNSYSGLTAVLGGTLEFASPGSLGTGQVLVDGGTLRYAPGNTSDLSSRGFDIGANGASIDTNGNTVTFANAIGSGSSGPFTKTGAGTLVLGGSNSYTGGTQITGGVLSISRAENLGAASNPLALNGGALRTTGNVDLSGPVSLSGNSTFDLTNETYLNIFNTISGAGGLTKTGSGFLTLIGAQTYTGPTDVQGGFFKVESGSLASVSVNLAAATFHLSNSSGIYAGDITGAGTLNRGGAGMSILAGTVAQGVNTILGSGALQIGNGGTTGTINGDIANAGQVIFHRSDDVVYSGIVSGTGTLQKLGAATLTLTGNNTLTGPTTISEGTLRIGSGGATGAVAGNIINDGTLVFNRSDAVLFSGVISGTGSLEQQGTSDLILAGDNIYTGQTIIGQGTLVIGNGGTTGSITSSITGNGSLAFNRSDNVLYGADFTGSGRLEQRGSGTLVLTGTSSGAGGVAVAQGTLQIGGGGTTGWVAGNISNAGVVAFNRSDNIIYDRVISGSGGMSQLSAAKLTLTASNTFTGTTTVSQGILEIGAGGLTGSIAGDIANGGQVVFNRSNDVTFGGAISGTGSLQKLGAATLTLTGNNTFTGATTISEGILQIGSGGATGSISGDIVNNGALRFNRTGTLTYGGAISGTGTLNKLGSGTLNLTGSSSYSGGTTVTAGVLGIASDSALGVPGGTLTFQNGTLQALGDLILERNLAVTTSANINTNGFLIDLASFSGAGSVTVLGAGQLTLTGSTTLAGRLTNSASNPLRIASSALVNVVGGSGILGNVALDGELRFSQGGSFSFSPSLSGAGLLVQAGPGRTALNAASGDFSGEVRLQGGTLEVGNDTALGTGLLTISGGTIRAGGAYRLITNQLAITGDFGIGYLTDLASDFVLTADRTITMNNPGANGGDSFLRGVISGSHGLTVSAGANAGALGLSGTNTYTGNTTITNGAVLAISSQANLGAASGTLVFQNGTLRVDGDFDLNGRAIALNGNAGIDTNGHDASLSLADATGDGSVTKVGDGSLTLTGSSAFTGGTILQGGVLQFTAAENFGTGGIFLQGGTLRYGAGLTTDLSSRLVIGSGSIDTNGNDVVFAGTPGGSDYSLTKTGLGSLTLSGSFSSLRNLAVNDGLLNLAGNLPNLASLTVTGGTAQHVLSPASTVAYTLRTGGTLELSQTGSTSIRSSFNMIGGTLRLQGSGTTVFDSTVTYRVQGDLVAIDEGRMVMSVQNPRRAVFFSDIQNNAILEMQINQGSYGFDNVISGSGEIVKSGTGTLSLNAGSTFSGTTTVSAGKLLVNGSILGDVAVQNGGTLGGSGVLGGAVVLQVGATLSPGNSPGQLTVEDNLTMVDGSFLVMEFGGTGTGLYDQLDVQGTFVAGGTLNIQLINGFTPVEGDAFLIFNGLTPGFETGSFSLTTNLGGGLSWDTSALASSGIVSVVPEPGALALLTVAGAVLLAARHRKRR